MYRIVIRYSERNVDCRTAMYGVYEASSYISHFEMRITHNRTEIQMKINIFLQFARGFRRLSDKIQSNRKYGQCIAFFAVCIVKISAVSSIVSPPPFIHPSKNKNKNRIENFYSVLFSVFYFLLSSCSSMRSCKFHFACSMNSIRREIAIQMQHFNGTWTMACMM